MHESFDCLGYNGDFYEREAMMKGIRRKAHARFHLVGVRYFGRLLMWSCAMHTKLVPSESESVM